MGEKMTKILGMSFGSFLLAALALNWKEIFTGFSLLPDAVHKLAVGLPFGWASCLISLATGCTVWYLTHESDAICKGRPHSCSAFMAVLASTVANTLQQWAGGSGTPIGWMWAVLLGFNAGAVAAVIATVAWSWLSPPKESRP